MKHHLLKSIFLVASARAKQPMAHFPLVIILLQLSLRALPASEFHVAITGNDANPGTQAAPLRTIQRAAELAQPGDTVTVHAGVYRERVNPPRGGESDTKRIVYQAATGEQVVITGSEEVKNWEKVQDGVWKATIPNTLFGSFNPYTNLIQGDWFQPNGPREHHTGAVYLNGDWLGEAAKLDEVLKPAGAAPLWFGRVDQTNTTLWAQFKEVNPNAQRVEINTRQTVFYPVKPGINYITVRGFTMRHAATQWAPPTAEQMGLIGTHWSKGWIIENNTISHSKCTGIALGKYGDQWDNTSGWRAEGYLETIQRALSNGWNKATVGSHLVRNNDISHCEQAGVVGSLGCSFSVVTGNIIHDIHVQRLFGGVEMAGIKFHGAIDVEISRNHLYRCYQGIWLDWMAQGARVTGNLLHDNLERDLFFEANHGPFLVDNNVCLSPVALWAWSEGGAYVHNLFAGEISTHGDDDRMTPFHRAHSTAIAGLHKMTGGDDRYYNNVLVQRGDLSPYDTAKLPVKMGGNVFFQGTKSSKHERDPILRSGSDPALALVEKNDSFYLTMTLATALGSERPSQPVTSARLGKASISGCAFENPDGSPITIGKDYFGKPRNTANPTPGPFEAPGTGTLTMKLWPLTVGREALLTALPVRADDLAAPVPAPADFWVRDQTGRITHACGGKEPLVLCMQGRKVVMQVQSDRTNGFSYTARFFNLQKEVEKKQALFVAGRESTPEVRVNDQPWKSEFPSSVTFDGLLTLTYPEAVGVVVTRTVYPSMTKALVIEEWQVRNTTGKRVAVTVAPARTVKPVGEDIAIVWSCPEVKAAEVKAGGVLSFSTCVQAGLAAGPDPAVNVAAERGARLELVEAAWRGSGRLETPEPLLDHAFALQKLHVLESPIETIKGVITHNGSLTYSPGIWANDPVEYSSPLFPFFGDAELNKASMNMYRVWLDYGREHGGDAIPGCFWQPTLQVGQWERGDDAMVLYGLSKFLLFQGDRAAAEEMWPLIEMCAASVLKHTTADGIVASKTDEMEGRYPTGDANLSTSSLAYGGYRLAARLAQSLGKPAVAEFDKRAEALRKAIESYFGGEVEGFKTYRYYKENTTLRGWILLPLAMGITERKEATVAALMSDKLWPQRQAGADILAESTRPTEWGRETYYALRVLFKAGRTEEAIDLTRRVVQAQIFGSKGPYPDEDAIDMLCPGSLYPRVFTEGMFGIVPTGLNSFECTPWLPKDWPRMALRDLRAFGQSWDLVVERVGDQQKVTVLSGSKTLMTGLGPAGKTYSLTLSNVKK